MGRVVDCSGGGLGGGLVVVGLVVVGRVVVEGMSPAGFSSPPSDRSIWRVSLGPTCRTKGRCL